MAGKAQLRPSQLRPAQPGTDQSHGAATAAMTHPLPIPSGRIVLNVGGTRFETYKSTLAKFPTDSYIGRLTTLYCDTFPRDADGSYFFDRDGKAFAAILQAARMNRAPRCPVDMPATEWIEELQYWGMTGDSDATRDEELQERKRNLDARINDSRIRKIRTIALVLSKHVTSNNNKALEFVVPKDNPSESFDAAYEEFTKEKEKYEKPSSFSWADTLNTKEMRVMLRKSGYVARVKQASTRFRTERAHHYPSLLDMIGKDVSKKTMTVARFAVEATTGANDEDSEVSNELAELEKKKKKRRRPNPQEAAVIVPAAAVAVPAQAVDQGSDSESGSSSDSQQQQTAPPTLHNLHNFNWNDPPMYME